MKKEALLTLAIAAMAATAATATGNDCDRLVEGYGRTDASLEPVADIPDGATGYTVTFYRADGAKGDDNRFDIMAARAGL